MKLRDLKINQVTFWYQTYMGQEEALDEDGHRTGEKVNVYSEPVKAVARVAPHTGDTDISAFGADVDYDRSISTVQDLPINIYSKCFIETEPEFNDEGELVNEADYYCILAQKDLEQKVWALKKIKAEQT